MINIPICRDCGNEMDAATLEFIATTKGDREVPDVCGVCMLDMIQEAIDNIPDQSSRARNGKAT